MVKQKKSNITDITTFKNKIFYTKTDTETRELGKSFAKILKPKDIVFFNGNLGAGKTTFIQGILSFFGIKKFVRSASFMLVSEFETKVCPVYHLDLYRLDENNTLDLGIDEYLFGDGISLVEWCDRLKHYNIKQRWEINIDYTDNGRKIKIERFL
ncbi:MAG: tRNA (adenosine(37)-N6)-threonylcarbamoyltransferase complex ATPase subunit type 1 TsaE [Elusimicrobia bacterium]|jgi:tRNA threonylcarbamoyladenosine biosynthesis protein TsaE|nr:tRNA (adenosine(37)-N6)-threonylcarbamoyltransferase complex ATPase subunit type 1 TsaE [Elusimicrobiota bacterium]